MKKYLVGICAFNEGQKIKRVIEKYVDYSCYDVVIVDDGSTDGSLEGVSSQFPISIVRNDSTRGAGYGTRQIVDYGQKGGYETVIFVSGNDKDDANDVRKLIEAIEQGFDFVQGSRYLPGGQFGKMPFYRIIATRLVHPLLFSLISGQRITDSTNGFRATRLSFYDDERMDIRQSWLDAYELEVYVFYMAIKLKYKVTEVPVSKIYPPKKEGYTKMRPFSGWWSILRPLILLGLRIKK